MTSSYCGRSVWLLALLLLAGLVAQAQASLNLGLEPRANHGQPLALWQRRRAPGVRVQFDSTVFRQGRGSLRLELVEEEERQFTVVYTTLFPLDSLRGQIVTVSGWVRTRGFRGKAGLYAFAHTTTTDGPGSDHTFAVDSLPGAMDWRRFEVRLPVKATAQGFGMGLRAWGNGRVWFDDIQVRVNGKLLRDAPLAGTEALLLTPSQALAPNWDFERPLPPLASPDPARATVALDSAQPQHGRRYLRLTRISTTGPAPAVYLGTLKLGPELLGKSVQVTGYWRQVRAGAVAGEAPGLAYTLLSTDQGSNYHNNTPTTWGGSELQLAPALPTPGPQWTAFSASIPVPNDHPRLAALALSLRLPSGTVELDNLQFALNGAPYVPVGPPTPAAPTTAEAAWLRTALKPLRLGAPPTDFQDLAPLGSLLESARLVGVGEVGAGSHEAAELKNRVLRYLIGQKGFTGLVLDASPVHCAALNDYLQTGRGDAARLLAALGTSNTTEMLDLVRWLRSYNQAHAAKVFVAGMDVRQPELALTQLGQTVEATDDFAQVRLQQLRQLLAATTHPTDASLDLRLHPDQAQDSLLPQVRRLTAELAAGLDTRAKVQSGSPPSLRTLARQRYYLRLVEQGATLRRLPPDFADNYRAACLAENVQYLSQHEGPAGGSPKLVIWAHNQQIANSAGAEHSLGQWLRATHGTNYFALGLALGQGQYTSENANDQRVATPLETAPPGSYEAWLRTGPPAFLVGLTKLELGAANAWIFQQQLLRDVSTLTVRHQFGLHDLRGEFDAVVFLRDSTPAHFLP
ncbi:MAG: erythromycin esterase family protein [Janthinobacterium lividum]